MRNGFCKKINPLNASTISAVVRAAGLDADSVQVGKSICRESCYTDEMISQHSELAAAAQHVGKSVARIADDDGLRQGVVKCIGTKPTSRVAATFVIEWRDLDGTTTKQRCVFSVLKPFLVLGGLIEAQRAMAVAEAVRKNAEKERKRANRLEKKMAQDATEEAASGGEEADYEMQGGGFIDDDPMRGENDGELNKSQRRTLRRALSRRTIFDRAWWESLTTRDGKPTYRTLHTYVFGFEEPGDLRSFYDKSCQAYFEKRSSRNGLGSFEYYCLAIMKMRTGLSNIFLGSLMGTDASHLGRKIATWIHLLGAFSKVSLIGLPPAECLEALMPQDCINCGMADTGLIGDGCSFLTEQVRIAWMSAVGNQMYDSKTDHAGALGMLFTSANGGACVASPLYLGRASEGNGVRALRNELKGLPTHMAVCYDKGIRGLRTLLPNYNHVYMPNFLRPSEGKNKFTLDEAIENKGIATNRYVVEIAFQRVKAWKLLSGEIPREHFHLLDSTWWWALGFSNMYLRMLKEPAV